MNVSFKRMCPFCKSKRLYKVSSSSIKCASCQKKYSVARLEKDLIIMEYFCNDITANECAKTLNINYKNVKERFESFRKLLFLHSEQTYSNKDGQFSEYDEYYYLPQNKRGHVKYLFDAIGILGMVYEQSIYTLLLPDEFFHLRSQKNSDKQVDMAYINSYAKYLNRYKIVHYERFDSLILNFWVYLEKQLSRYKGIQRENFVYYLKEYEFKFNYKKEDRLSTLWKLWIDVRR